MVGATQPLVGRAQAFAGRGRAALRVGQARSVGRVGRKERRECLARLALGRRRLGDRGAQSIALDAELGVALRHGRRLAVGARHPFLGHDRRGLGPCAPMLGVPSARIVRGEPCRQAIAPLPELSGAGLPCREGVAFVIGRLGVGCSRPDLADRGHRLDRLAQAGDLRYRAWLAGPYARPIRG